MAFYTIDYTTAYDAVILGMDGDLLVNDDYGKYNYLGILDAIRMLGIIDNGETRSYSIGNMVGMISHNDEGDAIDWASKTHESQNPAAFTVTRKSRNRWTVARVW